MHLSRFIDKRKIVDTVDRLFGLGQETDLVQFLFSQQKMRIKRILSRLSETYLCRPVPTT